MQGQTGRTCLRQLTRVLAMNEQLAEIGHHWCVGPDESICTGVQMGIPWSSTRIERNEPNQCGNTADGVRIKKPRTRGKFSKRCTATIRGRERTNYSVPRRILRCEPSPTILSITYTRESYARTHARSRADQTHARTHEHEAHKTETYGLRTWKRARTNLSVRWRGWVSRKSPSVL